MATAQQKYIIPLRKETQKVPNYKRAKKAVSAVKQFLCKHMKGNTVKIGPALNKALWKHGMRNPPHKIAVEAVKDDTVIYVELEGHKYLVKLSKEKKSGLRGKLEGLIKGKKAKGTEEPTDEGTGGKKTEESDIKPSAELGAEKQEKAEAPQKEKTPQKAQDKQ